MLVLGALVVCLVLTNGACLAGMASFWWRSRQLAALQLPETAQTWKKAYETVSAERDAALKIAASHEVVWPRESGRSDVPVLDWTFNDTFKKNWASVERDVTTAFKRPGRLAYVQVNICFPARRLEVNTEWWRAYVAQRWPQSGATFNTSDIYTWRASTPDALISEMRAWVGGTFWWRDIAEPCPLHCNISWIGWPGPPPVHTVEVAVTRTVLVEVHPLTPEEQALVDAAREVANLSPKDDK